MCYCCDILGGFVCAYVIVYDVLGSGVCVIDVMLTVLVCVSV